MTISNRITRIADLVGWPAASAKRHMQILKGAGSTAERRLYLQTVEAAEGIEMRRTLELEFGEWWQAQKGARDART